MTKSESIKRADKEYNQFREMIEQAFLVDKNGYDNKGKKEADEQMNNLILQGSMNEAITAICNAAITLRDINCKKRLLYFKTCVIYCETIKAFENVSTVSFVAMNLNFNVKYFKKLYNKYNGMKNYSGSSVFDMEDLFNKLAELNV